jgi:hypothetical protein
MVCPQFMDEDVSVFFGQNGEFYKVFPALNILLILTENKVLRGYICSARLDEYGSDDFLR